MVLVKLAEPFVVQLPCWEGCRHLDTHLSIPEELGDLGFKHIEILIHDGTRILLPQPLCWYCVYCLVADLWEDPDTIREIHRHVVLLDLVCPRGPHEVTFQYLQWELLDSGLVLSCERHDLDLVPKPEVTPCP